MLQDLRFAFRQLRKAPSFAVTAVLTLALGIGANTAIFSLVDSMLLKPLPVPDAEHMMSLVSLNNNRPLLYFSLPEFKAIRDQGSSSFSSVFAYTVSLDGLSMEGQQPQRVMTSYVSGNFFSGLGLKPAVGRLILPSEGEVFGSDPVIVLDYNYWQRKFSGDPNVVGRTVTMDGQRMTIVGVAPKGFQGLGKFATVSVYMPLSELPITGLPGDAINKWQLRMFLVNAMRRPEVSLSKADAELSLLANGIAREQPETEKRLGIEGIPADDPSRSLDPTTLLLATLFQSLAALVLLLACVNVANLVLVRATVQKREMAIRSALGAGRSRLIRQAITESVLLALMGGIAGVPMGIWATHSLSYFLAMHLPPSINLTFPFDWSIFLYSFLIAALAGLAVGLAPALRIVRTNVNSVLHEGGHGLTAGRTWVRDGLVALQIAVAVVLLVVSGLFVHSLVSMQTMDFGFNPEQVLNFSIDPNEVGLTVAQTRDLAADITARLHQLPGVQAVSHASSVPFGSRSGDQMIVDGAPASADSPDTGAFRNVVSPEYFRVMGIQLLRGRNFTDADNEHSLNVAIISESTAQKFWPHQDALGRTFRMGFDTNRKLEVVGIARDAEFLMFGDGKQIPLFYLPYAQNAAWDSSSPMVFQLRTQGDPLALAPTVEQAVHQLVPQLPIFQMQTMHEACFTLFGLLLYQIGATVAGIMGGLGLTLAVLGLYGVVSYSVSQRVHEIGLRMSLGASRGNIFRMIYRRSLTIIAAGLGIGLALALLMARVVGAFIKVSVWDPATFLSVAAVMALAALASCYWPAQRAMAVEPTVALREE